MQRTTILGMRQKNEDKSKRTKKIYLSQSTQGTQRLIYYFTNAKK